MVARDLRVDPVEVRLAGGQVDGHAGDFLAGHVAANARIAAARRGFIGDSVVALGELAAHWNEESASHHRELCEHAEDLRAAAGIYEATDTDVATTIEAAAADLAKRMEI
jgi:uncharacterized protein YukE